MQSKLVGGIGGSWLASKDKIAAKDWAGITDLARKAIAIRDTVRGAAR
jgi:2-dehydro-3-deoxyphosphogluconate aldolase/(4S)-4-hydroxy-2-oxoglutarate aldolase